MLHNYYLYENDGKLSTNSDEQSSEDLVDASGINIKDMGDQSSLQKNPYA